MEPDFTSSQQRKHKEQEDAVLNALAALGSAAQEDGENPDVDPLAPAAASSSTASSSTVLSSGTPSSDTPNVYTAESVETAESTNTTEPPEITDDTDFSTWTVDDYRAVKAEDLAKLPDDIPLAPEAEAQEVREAMYDVVDPELGVNVVDLGLVYDVKMDIARRATIDMTLTSPACPLTDVIEDQAFVAVCTEGHARALRINWVWMPPWGAHMITDDGREQLRALGFTL